MVAAAAAAAYSSLVSPNDINPRHLIMKRTLIWEPLYGEYLVPTIHMAISAGQGVTVLGTA